MFYMITPFVEPSDAVLQSIVDVEALIDGVILRLDGREDELDVFIMQLKRLIDPSKIIVHNIPHLMMKHGLTRIHFKECAGEAIAFKQQHPEFRVGMSVHSEDSVHLIDGVLDYCIFGHIFPTPSKPGLTPQSASVIDTVLSYDIPVVAIGGIDEQTVHQLDTRFSGFSGIRLFQHKAQLEHVQKEWLLRNSMS
ncbi:thiamine phosphate synthase [Macrococcoides canis]|uniref:thiamine phosphate synthase n=1 Tax=Macrococcoides canis TaxID=1855823 RepID=UPI001F3607D5|nr:thiamine phosphate synthase [Macrococcus canis]UJS27991.1 thiamine phosphate synthase [Macrococcus canis]